LEYGIFNSQFTDILDDRELKDKTGIVEFIYLLDIYLTHRIALVLLFGYELFRCETVQGFANWRSAHLKLGTDLLLDETMTRGIRPRNDSLSECLIDV
jgi:hypothetical protein